MLPHQLNPVIEKQFNAVTDYILNNLASNVPLVEKIGHYIVESGGKRLRPLLTLLSANACGYQGSQHIPLAAVIEFIHTATLLHDDIVDNSELRRGNATANDKWGNGPSVLVGDFLYSRSFQIMVDIGNMGIMQVMSNATNTIAEGEVLQLLNQRNPDTTEDAYFAVIKNKTAMLFQAAAECGALLAGATKIEQHAMALYGLHLGTGFQIIDDLMDYISSAADMGKNVGDDLAEGKVTLPLIYAMQNANTADRDILRKAIRQSDVQALDSILSIVEKTGAIIAAKKVALTEIDKACEAIQDLHSTPFKDTLIQLAQLSKGRTN